MVHVYSDMVWRRYTSGYWQQFSCIHQKLAYLRKEFDIEFDGLMFGGKEIGEEVSGGCRLFYAPKYTTVRETI